MLPLVVDAIGWNIQIRTTHLDYRPPYPEGLEPGELGTGAGADHTAGYKNLVWHPDLAGPYLFEAPSLDGRLPFMEIKVGYYLSDLTERNSGAICLVPGSHRRTPQELRDMNYRVPADQFIELNVPANTALLWRTQVWHCVTPNLSSQRPQGVLRRVPLPLAAADRLRPAGSGADRAQLADSPPAAGRAGSRGRPTGQGSGLGAVVAVLADQGLGRRATQSVGRGAPGRRCQPAEKVHI